MTNEEIRRAAVGVIQERSNELLPGAFVPNLRQNIENAIRKAVSQAYEEAETAVLNYDVRMAEEMRARTDVARTYSEQAATRVRRLKDSLCPHEWADVRNDVVTSGEMCLKCGAVRAGNATSVNSPALSS